ncbi:hypothetical protein CCZ37_07895 [Vibrio qinghaiensis]|jgi:hypothetical protein|uniref:Type II secretion system pilot lipoprotein GspS-beta n=1 Tax=Vibrio qinghaiensis TaxID=2025808 RepID=A0A223MYE5_9VIBR|nr:MULTISPECIES: GspS/AspS pilotin family protein [Vibrio]ASU22523.1 hypothetical protein CCZ37_07895 [Vibrio qinghaiensis]
MKVILCAVFATLLAVGCSSNGDQQKYLEALASNRAKVISAELPLEFGPLSVMRASSKGSTVEIMMIYNVDQKGAKPIDQVLKTSINSYCSDDITRANIDFGLTYRIKMRNTRGQLVVDQLINKETCTVQ